MPSLNLRAALKRNPNRPTLKQRAAALKATAGRVMRRRPAEVAPAASVADPRLTAMVTELLEARRKLNDPAVPDGPEADALGERETALSMEVYRFPARSIHDVAAKLPFFREEAEDAGRAWDVRRGEVFEESLPGAAWAGLLRDIEHLASTAPVAETAPDPILAAIEASKAAHAERDAWSQRFNGGAPLSAADFAEEDKLNGVQSLAHDAVIATVPTTSAGRLALLEYLRWQMGLYGMADGNPPDAGSAFWPDAYKALKAALAFDGLGQAQPTAEAAPDPIFAAIEANREAEARMDAFGREEDARPGAAARATRQEALARAQMRSWKTAFATRPSTPAGMRALADWIRWQLERHGEPMTGDGTVWADACLSLLAVVESLGGDPGSTPAVPAASDPARAIDLSKCSVRELARLYDTFAVHWLAASHDTGAPFAWKGDDYTPSGSILDAECDRLARMMDAIEAETAARQAVSEDDRDERLSLLIKHELLGNGRLHPGALLTEVIATWRA
ncbi:hypothetical protein ACIQW5_26905 [Methylorubrum thiocyanatum]|uniref:hypothetical protein n=1 Tax=Methylorubrum thiocyanatum TaxID=47958 RepID=UPI00383B069B